MLYILGNWEHGVRGVQTTKVYFLYETISKFSVINDSVLSDDFTSDPCLKGKCHEIFCFRFFHESPSPKPLKITLGSFRPMTMTANLPPVSTTPAANFANRSACVVNTGGKFAAGVNDGVGK
jgi:hypothetical protein